MKKLISYLLAVYFVVQLAVPGYFVYRHYDTLYSGESFKFVVEPYDPYDPFRGRYVSLNPEVQLYPQNSDYIVLQNNAEGFVESIERYPYRPSGKAYVQNLNLNRYYMNEQLAPQAERLQRELDYTKHTIYLLVKIKSGSYVIEGMYVDDIPIEEYLINQNV